MVAQRALDALGRRSWYSGGLKAHLAAQLNERIEDPTRRLDSLKHLLLVAPEGQHVVTFFCVQLLDARLVVPSPPYRQPGFLPQLDEAFVEIRVVERAPLVQRGSQCRGPSSDGAEGGSGRLLLAAVAVAELVGDEVFGMGGGSCRYGRRSWGFPLDQVRSVLGGRSDRAELY